MRRPAGRRRGVTASGATYAGPMYEFEFEIGQRVRVTHRVPRLSGTLTSVVEGEVVSYGQSKTGSWFAHSKDKKLWLDRVELRQDDGELVVVNLDQYTIVEPAPREPDAAAAG